MDNNMALPTFTPGTMIKASDMNAAFAEVYRMALDAAHPVGSYYETSDASFDPNEAWGGTWVEDTAGRVLVAKDTSTFAIVGDTGGEEKSSQLNCGDTQYGLSGVAYADRTIVRNPRLSASHGEISAQISLLQPYIVVKRWHRTA